MLLPCFVSGTVNGSGWLHQQITILLDSYLRYSCAGVCTKLHASFREVVVPMGIMITVKLGSLGSYLRYSCAGGMYEAASFREVVVPMGIMVTVK